ncbi:uncharacterized protein LOC134226169 [Armigeres subalbatus]|uniref:uncharacterized protein LOC134226169 n=1 Tax=Armigeres subalbatus TaxID=124917 RepID=UPI002ECFBB27
MKLHFDSKLCQYPKTYFAFVLNILLWNRFCLTKICTNCPFYRHSSTFAAIYLVVHLVVASQELIQRIVLPNEETDDKLSFSLRVWKLNLSFKISHQYLLLGRALFHVQALARSLYNLLVENYDALLGLILFVPLFFAVDVYSFVIEWNRRRGQDTLRTFIWKEAFKLGTTVIFWSNLCCLLYNQYAGCIFDK